jgi:hypothetical protein
MAYASSTAAGAAAAANLSTALGAPPSEKLSRDNHLFWKTQVLPALRGAQVMELLNGTDLVPPKTVEIEDRDGKKAQVPNPEYAVWNARDQTLMSYLVKSLDVDLLSQCIGLEHAHEIWKTIEDLFASQSRVVSIFLEVPLLSRRKKNSQLVSILPP